MYQHVTTLLKQTQSISIPVTVTNNSFFFSIRHQKTRLRRMFWRFFHPLFALICFLEIHHPYNICEFFAR